MDKRIGLTDFPDDSNWVVGYVEEMVFHAKLYDEGSEYGIDGGRVSKLFAGDPISNEHIAYDRGWDTGKNNSLVREIVKFLEKQPTRFK